MTPNPPVERDAPKAARPSPLRWASKTKTAWLAFGKCCWVSFDFVHVDTVPQLVTCCES